MFEVGMICLLVHFCREKKTQDVCFALRFLFLGQFFGEFPLHSLSVKVENCFGGFLSRNEALLELLLGAGPAFEVSGEDVALPTLEDEENRADR